MTTCDALNRYNLAFDSHNSEKSKNSQLQQKCHSLYGFPFSNTFHSITIQEPNPKPSLHSGYFEPAQRTYRNSCETQRRRQVSNATWKTTPNHRLQLDSKSPLLLRGDFRLTSDILEQHLGFSAERVASHPLQNRVTRYKEKT